MPEPLPAKPAARVTPPENRCGQSVPILPPAQTAAWRVAWVAGVFSVVVILALVAGYSSYQSRKPLDSPVLADLKNQLALRPQDEPLKKLLRQVDLELRVAHDTYLRRTRIGVWLLVGGLVVFLGAIQTANWRKKLCLIKKLKKPGDDWRGLVRSSAAVGGLGVLIAVGATVLMRASGTHLHPRLLASAATNAVAGLAATNAPALPPGPSRADVMRNWGRFRGPDGNATIAQATPPVKWDLATGEGVLWKVPASPDGFNSPVIWGDKLFLTGGSPKQREVFCFETGTGKLLWQKAVEQVPGSAAELPEVPEQTGFAAATAACDDERVYAIFANLDLVAFKHDGQLAWAKGFGTTKNAHGHATSVLVWDGRLIVQLDQGETEDHLSKLYAFEAATGKVIWQKSRPVGSSWATPIVIEAASRQQIITLAVPWVIAYDFKDGAELWRVECLSGEVTPSPIFVDGKLLVLSPSEKLLAIKPDGQGDVTKTHILWTAEDNIPDIGSPVSTGELVFTLNTMGILSCWEGATGKKLWQKDYGDDCHPSLSLVGGKLYCFTTKGKVFIVTPAREYQELAALSVGEAIYASPAFTTNRMFVRTAKSLIGLGSKP
jgi:outer membrane protein assembly factor BamB